MICRHANLPYVASRPATTPDLRDRLDGIAAPASDGGVEHGPVATWQRRRGPVRIYKNRGKGSRYAPRCVACFPASVPGQVIPMRFGCQLVLCPSHRDPRFLETRTGRDFLAAIGETLKSFGIRNTKHNEALIVLLRSVVHRHHPTPRRRPGSYAWPGPRHAAEQVWADGGDYHEGEAAALALTGRLPTGVRLPSPHTIRRWWRELRWLLQREPSPRTLTATEPRPAPTLHAGAPPVSSAGPLDRLRQNIIEAAHRARPPTQRRSPGSPSAVPAP